MPSSHSCLDVKASSDNCPQLMEKMSSTVSEHALKVRKPYTITKQRERWTEEEHNKFLEALKLHGRAWRQIEEHVGTKTAVQIRSHAQKFFTKVVRESAGDSTGEAKTVEIPPPRPKRKPAHPYPRKLGNLPSIRVAEEHEQDNASEPKLTLHDQDNLSPTSVLSAVGSSASELVNSCTSPDSSVVGSDPVGTSLHEQENGCQSATTSVETLDKLLATHNSDMELDFVSGDSVSGMGCTPVEAPAACLKLFGKMVVMADPQKPPCSTIGSAERCPEPYSASTTLESHRKGDDIGQQGQVHNQNAVDGAQTLPFGEHNCQLTSWPMFYLLPSPASLQSSAGAGAAPLPCMWAFYGGASAAAAGPLSLNSEQDQLPSGREFLDDCEGGVQKEISLADSNAASASIVEASIGDGSANASRAQHCGMKLRQSETSAFRRLKAGGDKTVKGFVPYKRRVPEKGDRQRVLNEREEGQGVWLCL